MLEAGGRKQMTGVHFYDLTKTIVWLENTCAKSSDIFEDLVAV